MANPDHVPPAQEEETKEEEEEEVVEEEAEQQQELDYQSTQVIHARFQEMLHCVSSRRAQGSELHRDELLRAGRVLVACLTTKPQFRNLKLYHMERVVFPVTSNDNDNDEDGAAALDADDISRPSTAQLERLHSPWLPLADLAYQYPKSNHDETLQGEIQKLLGDNDDNADTNWRLVQHKTDVAPGGVGYYLAVNATSKKILIGLKGTSTMSVRMYVKYI